MSGQITIPQIKELLQAQVENLARTLLPHGKRNGGWWVACDPVRGEKSPSLGVRIAGGVPGAWRDFGGEAAGDIIQLIAHVNGFAPVRKGASRADVEPTVQWAKAFLGIDGAAAPVVAQRIAEARAQADARAAAGRDADVDARNKAYGLYLHAKRAPFIGSPADRYLKSRGIDVAQLPAVKGKKSSVPGALGWYPDAFHRESNAKWPVMLAAFTDEQGTVAAVHRTYLAHDGAGKAPVAPVRKIWPGFKGAAIRLWRGKSGRAIDSALRAYEKHGECETLVLVEGVEDGLSVALACPDYRVWAAGSLGNLAEIIVPRCCDEVIVCADNDWGKPQAEALLDKAIARLAQQGPRVRIARSTIGKDVNDALRG